MLFNKKYSIKNKKQPHPFWPELYCYKKNRSQCKDKGKSILKYILELTSGAGIIGAIIMANINFHNSIQLEKLTSQLQNSNSLILANLTNQLQQKTDTHKAGLDQSLFVDNELYKKKLDAFKKVLDLMDRYIPYRIENTDQQYKSWSLHYRSLYIKKQKKPSIDEIREAYNLIYVYSINPETISDFIDCIGRYSGKELPSEDPLIAYHNLRSDIRKELFLKSLDFNDLNLSPTETNDKKDDWNHSSDFSYIISDYHFNDALLSYNRRAMDSKLEPDHSLDYLIPPENIKNMKKNDIQKYHKNFNNN